MWSIIVVVFVYSCMKGALCENVGLLYRHVIRLWINAYPYSAQYIPSFNFNGKWLCFRVSPCNTSNPSFLFSHIHSPLPLTVSFLGSLSFSRHIQMIRKLGQAAGNRQTWKWKWSREGSHARTTNGHSYFPRGKIMWITLRSYQWEFQLLDP